MLRDRRMLFGRLLQFLTIPVSEMFRDPAYFLGAAPATWCRILHTYASVKVWVAGCSTGEEVFSLAILLREEGLLERTQIYATDINPASLRRRARASSARGDPRLHRQLPARGRTAARFPTTTPPPTKPRASTPRCAPTSIFADHSLATDSVFAETQLVSCRNVLIYFNRELQNRALGLFHESLSAPRLPGAGLEGEHRFLRPIRTASSTHARAERIYRKAT